jgi:sec-independent protein translocase protein TatB
MFNFGTWGEIVVILITALIVVGPKDIPKTLKMIGRWVFKIRHLTQQVTSYVDELAFQAQRDDIMSSKRDTPDDEKHRRN